MFVECHIENLNGDTLFNKLFRLDPSFVNDMFLIFNISGDGSMSKHEFSGCWDQWIKKVTNFSLIQNVAFPFQNRTKKQSINLREAQN